MARHRQHATPRRPVPQFGKRPHVWLGPHDPLVCPRGHKLHTNAAVLEHDAFTCQHTAPDRGHEQGPCGATVYVVAFPAGLRFVAEVTREELLHMRAERMTMADVLNYLGNNPFPTGAAA